jgi:hypothetical protein
MVVFLDMVEWSHQLKCQGILVAAYNTGAASHAVLFEYMCLFLIRVRKNRRMDRQRH